MGWRKRRCKRFGCYGGFVCPIWGGSWTTCKHIGISPRGRLRWQFWRLGGVLGGTVRERVVWHCRDFWPRAKVAHRPLGSDLESDPTEGRRGTGRRYIGWAQAQVQRMHSWRRPISPFHTDSAIYLRPTQPKTAVSDEKIGTHATCSATSWDARTRYTQLHSELILTCADPACSWTLITARLAGAVSIAHVEVSDEIALRLF
jgi:hypothetical protein